jgi:integrase
MKRWDREPLTPAEIDAVIDAARDNEERTIMTVLADTGCRVNELLRIRKDWLHWRKGAYGVLRIPVKDDYSSVPGTTGRGPKTKKPRNVPMTLRLHDVLQAWFKDRGGFFRTYNHVYNVCVRSGKAAGVAAAHSKGFRVTPHIFRHSFITSAFYNADLKPQEIGALVGHVGGGVVESTYLHIDENETARKMQASGWLER